MYNARMVKVRILRLFFYSLAASLALSASFGCSLRAQPKLHTWFHYHGEKSLQKLEPYKELLSSVSLFGNPDRKFVAQCR
ncbi:MAG: hypothetical protein VX675_00890, partial [Planctomycetota bacterium]|nr:hypothetical protein [Planctomycetota bacterium]